MDETDYLLRHSSISSDPFKIEANLKALNAFEEIIRTSVGPRGHLKHITNVEGGVGIMTSSSKKLLQGISFKNIILKSIVKSVHNHLIVFKNGGLVALLVVLELIKHSVTSEIFLPMIGKLFEHFGILFIGFLKAECNECILTTDWSDLCQIKSLVETILVSKPLCCLSRDSVKHLSVLLIKTHLNLVPSNSSAFAHRKINYIVLPSDSPINSKLLNGLLVRFPEVSKDLDCFPWSLEKQLHNNINLCKGRNLKIVLYSISFAGDAEFPVDKIEVYDSVDVWKSVFNFLQNLIKKIIDMNVHIFACQKVVHPSLRRMLEKANVLVLDRLGAEVASNLQYLSGFCNSSFFGEISVGSVTNISIEKFGTRKEDPKFMLLANGENPFWTLLIRNHCIQAAEETKIVCEQALDTLWRLLKKPLICYGAGCTDIYTSQLVEKKVLEDIESIKTEYGCSSSQVLEALQIFLRSIAGIPFAIHQSSSLNFMTEASSNHLWKIKNGSQPSSGDRCLCGAKRAVCVANSGWKFLDKTVGEFFNQNIASGAKCSENSDQPVVLDELSCKVNAYCVAFETASLLLRSTLCIQS